MRAMGLSFAIGQRIGHENHGMRPQEVLPRDGDRRRFRRFKGSVLGPAAGDVPERRGISGGMKNSAPCPKVDLRID